MVKKHGLIRLKRLRVKKRSKQIQKFVPEKIQNSIIKAGGELKLAAQTTRDVVNHILQKSQTPVVTSKDLADTVIKELKKKDKELAKKFKDGMEEKKA